MQLSLTRAAPGLLTVRAPDLDRRGLLTALRDDVAAADTLTAALAAAPFPAFCLELPPVTAENAGLPAELVVVESPRLAAVSPDPAPFADPLRASIGDIAVFTNLGGDATLVVPRPTTAPGSAHLAVFVRSAPPAVARALWQAVGSTTLNQLSRRPLWVSTAGLGVSWLHVRLDRSPKYYRHAPYRDTGA